MFCPNCGKALPDGAKFCSGCGLKLEFSESAFPAPAPSPKAAKKKPTKWIILAVVLIAAIAGGLFAYRHFVTEPRDAADYLVHCLKKSDTYESAEDFMARLDRESHDYFNAISKDYGKAALSDYFDDLFRDGDYHEYIHDLSVLQSAGYLTHYEVYTDQIIKDSALASLWNMGSAISASDVNYGKEISKDDGVYFRDVRIEDYDNVNDCKMYVDSAERDRYCGIVTARVYGSIFVWPVSSLMDNGYILIDADTNSYVFVTSLSYSNPADE